MSEPMQVTDEMREREKLFSAALRKVQIGIAPMILTEIMHERVRQEAKWGEQDHEFAPEYVTFYGVPRAAAARKVCDDAAERGDITFGDILIEEVAEAFEADKEEDQRHELIQVAAVAVAAIEAMDRRKLKEKLEATTGDAKAENNEPEAYEEFTVTARGKATKNFDVVLPKSVVDVDAWEKQVRGEVLAHLEAVGITEVETFEIEPKPYPQFEPGNVVEFRPGDPGADLDVLIIVRQEGATAIAFSTYRKEVDAFDARRLAPARDRLLDMTVNDTTTGDVVTYREMVERARKESL
jgi:hypothetical protein